MIRSLIAAVAATVALLSPVTSSAQPAAAPRQTPIPVSVTGGTPGVSIEFFLNSAKLADATANTTGGVDWVLDLSNMGKTKVTIYVDVCKDGKIVKVMFVTGSGEAPPEDESCRRRMAAMSFQSDCGVIRINLDLRNFGGRVVGCGLSFRDPKVFGPIAGGLVALPFVFGGGSGSPTAVSTTGVSPPPTATVPSTPPANTTSPAPPAQPPPVTIVAVTPRFFIVLVSHPQGASTSLICGIVQIDPPVAGVTWVLVGSGPGVLPNQNMGGTFNANGQASFRLGISQTGQYTLTLTTNNQGQMQTVTFPVNVGAQSFNCPTVS